MHNTYVVLLNFSLRQYSKMGPFTVSGYKADTDIVHFSKERNILVTPHICFCVESSKVSSLGSYQNFIKLASLSILYKTNMNYSLFASCNQL